MRKLFPIFLLILTLLLVSCKEPAPPPYEVELLPGNDVVYVGEQWVDAGCLLKVEGESIRMIREDNLRVHRANEYIIKYSYEYKDYYEVTCMRFVKVIENEHPTVLLNPGIDTIKVDTEYVDAGILYEDDLSTELTVEVISDVDTSTPGTYSIIYKVTDIDRNQTVVTRVVTVIE